MAVAGQVIVVLFSMVVICNGHNDLQKILEEVSQAANTFAVNFHRTKTQVSGGKTNTFFSPLSIYTALAMLNSGAGGETAYQLQKALNWNIIAHPNEEVSPAEKMRIFIDAALTTSRQNPVKFANKLWMQNNFCFSVCKRFAKGLQKNYDSDIETVNFAGSPEDARKQINSWVSDRTSGKIKDLMEAGTITTMTRLVLTNAIYFKSNWKYKFDEKHTRKERFDVTRTKTVTVDMMKMKTKMMYTQDSDNKVVELPYAADNISMIIILPRDVHGIEKLERSFTHSMLKKYLGQLRKKTVTMWLPKFTIESDIHLKDYLSLMGVRDVFDPSNADLSGITGYKGFFVTHAIHKAFVEVNEQGTEAAAATGISAGFRSFNPDEMFFTANHPFLFAIVHRPSSTILFHGEIVNPTVRVTSTHL